MPKQDPIIPQVFQLKATVRNSKPPIWRRLLVASDTSLGKLHRILQTVFGWDDYHMHQFRMGDRVFSDPQFGLDVSDERRIKLEQLITEPKLKMHYEYDFGDGWEIDIVVEKILPFDEKQPLPLVTDGKRAGPLEDSGGIWGYEAMVEILNDPSHPNYAEQVEWVYGDEIPEEGVHFDATAFDKDALNKALRSLK